MKWKKGRLWLMVMLSIWRDSAYALHHITWESNNNHNLIQMVIENYRRPHLQQWTRKERTKALRTSQSTELSPLLTVLRVYPLKQQSSGEKVFLWLNHLIFHVYSTQKLIALIEGSFICVWCICVLLIIKLIVAHTLSSFPIANTNLV